MKIKIHKPNFLLVLFAMYNLIYAVYMAGFLTRIVYLGALIIYLLASFFSIVYYKSGKIVLKQLKFWDETKLILLTAVCFIGVTLIRQIVYGNFGMFFIKRIFYLILPVLIVFCIVNTKVRNKEIFIYIILIRMIVQFVLTNIHHLTLRNILAISWFDTKSSLFESSQAHEFFIMTVILLCVKKRGLAILATVLCMLNFKRISFLLCILSWIVVPRLKEEEVPKWCVKVSFVMMLVSPFIMNWLYSSSGVTFFQRFGIDLDKFTSTRVTLVNFTLNHFKGQYNGYGAIRNYFEHYSTWYAHVGTMHCDVLSIYLECGILGLAVYVMNLLKICMKDQRVFAVLLYMFIEIIVSQFVESVPAWTLLFLFAALQDRNFVGKIKTKKENISMIGIITVFYSENCGSVLQAYAISRALQELGKQVVFINTKNNYSSHSKRRVILRIGKQLLKGNYSGAVQALQKYRYFSRVIHEFFPYIDLNDAFRKPELDTLVLGSDTIWDLERKNFSLHPELYWPQGTEKNIIIYAASAANTQLEKFKLLEYPEQALKTMQAISVRDQHTKKVISSLTDKEIDIVCDPTLLVSKKYFDCFKNHMTIDKYLVLYLFEELEQDEIVQIQEFAKKGCQIISIGKEFSWCDKTVVATLENFISYLSQASYVATNTFHGTIFSIIYQRQFVSFARKKKKVTEVLKTMSLEQCLYYPGKNVADILEMKLDYFNVEKQILQLRETSMEYLKKNLEGNKKVQSEGMSNETNY